MMYLGDFEADQAIYFAWNTNNADGKSVTRSINGTLSVYKDASNGTAFNTTQVTTGVTNDEDFDSRIGVHTCCITTTDAWYETGHDYIVVLSNAIIDSQAIHAALAHFSIENRHNVGTSGAYTGTPPTVGQIADAVWDEILTGATHNIATSAGRKLREASDVMVLREEETAQGGSLSSITLNASASSEDEFYDMSTLIIVSGTGAGQARTFTEYNGTTKVGVPCEDWIIAPDNTSHYIIRGHACASVYKMHNSIYTEIWNRIKRLIPFSI